MHFVQQNLKILPTGLLPHPLHRHRFMCEYQCFSYPAYLDVALMCNLKGSIFVMLSFAFLFVICHRKCLIRCCLLNNSIAWNLDN